MGLERRSPGRSIADGSEATPSEGPTLPPPAKHRATAGNTSDLLETLENATDLEAIKKAVDDAASVCGGLWLSYLFALFYFAVAAGAVTHEDLFFERAVKLPFLNIDLPMIAFFVLPPILFVIIHIYTLMHFVMLTDKAERFKEALHKKIGDSERFSSKQL